MIIVENSVPTKQKLEEAQSRLRDFICSHLHGGCEILSKGHGCTCPLCDFDRMRAAILREEAC